jgi:integrase
MRGRPKGSRASSDALRDGGSNGGVRADPASRSLYAENLVVESPQRDPECSGHVDLAVLGASTTSNCAKVPPAEGRRATEREEAVARPRWQAGHIRKRGKRNPVWVGCYREDRIAEDGSRLRIQRSVVLGPVSKDFGKRKAQRKLSERLAAINQGRHKPEVMISFERFVTERFEPNILPTLRFSTTRNYRHLVRRHLFPVFGPVPLPEIGPADIQAFLAGKSKRYAPKTVLELRNLLSKIFSTAQKWGCIVVNPASGAQVPALVDTRERITLTPQQVRALLAVLSEPYRTMVLLAVLSGLRRGELFGLRWKWVNFEDGSVTVAESSYEGHLSPPKTRASRRKVFVGAVAMEALARLSPQNAQPEDFVFRTERGTPLNPNNVRARVLLPACERAKVPRIGWHNLRYTYATWADPTGESIKALQSQLGHTDSRLTLGVYTQPMPAAQRQLAEKIERVLLPNAAKFELEAERAGGLLN